MPTVERPKRILYGVYRPHDSLCFVEEGYGRALAAEIEAVKRCTTVGDAIALTATLKLTYVPGAPENRDDMIEQGLSPDEAYDWSEAGAVIDGDWPVMPTALSLRVFNSEDREAWSLILEGDVGGRIVDTVLNGDYLEISVTKGEALVAAFEELGVGAARDDALMLVFGD